MALTRLKIKGRRDYGRYYNVPHSIAETPAYRSLSAHAFKLWHDLMLQYDGKNNGRIDAILTRLENRGWKNGTLYRALSELQEKGLIVKTRQGGIGAMKKVCSLYRFTHLATDTDKEIGLTKSPPTNNYRAWEQGKNAAPTVGTYNSQHGSYEEVLIIDNAQCGSLRSQQDNAGSIAA